MLSYNEIMSFVKNIYYAKDRTFNMEFAPMWVREITNTNASVEDLIEAEKEIIREDVPLVISNICEVIVKNKKIKALPVKAVSGKCPYCNGKGYVLGVKFNRYGQWEGDSEYALNCVCENAHLENTRIMTENVHNFHKTMCRDGGYYLIFPTIVDKFKYLDSLEKK